MRLYWLILVVVTVGIISAVLYLASPLIKEIYFRQVMTNPTALLSAEDKEIIYQKLAADLPGIYEAVPDPNVGKLLQKNISKTQRQASVVTNNVGLRDDRPYTQKASGTFRIVCLGDSFVEGTGGRVEDRFCNQLEDMINEYRLLGEGKTAQAYAVGVGSWSAVNEASYMISHLSAYEPDLIIILLVSNDIADGQGVSGIGTASNQFSPTNRAMGSGVFSDTIASNFSAPETYLLYDLGPESVSRWQKTFALYKRLEDLQLARGGAVIFSVLNSIEFFTQLAMNYHSQAGMTSPFLITDYFPDEQNALPHDPHPSRAGHRILASHYLHAMAREGLIHAPDDELVPLHPGLDLDTSIRVDADYLAETREAIAEQYLPSHIEFNNLSNLEIQAFLGGIWPDLDSPMENRRQEFPYASIKAGFLLAREAKANHLAVELYLPPKPELYPNTIRMFVNGKLGDTLEIESVEQSGEWLLVAELDDPDDDGSIIEIMLRSETHWSSLTDHTMRSFELRKAYQSAEPFPDN